MDIFEKWDDIKNYFAKKKKKKAIKEENPDDILEEESPNSPSAKGSTGLIPGIKRQWVRGGAIFLTLVFVLAVIYGTDMGEEEQKKQNTNLAAKTDLPSKDAAKKATGTQDDYQALLEENKRRQAAANAQNPRPPQNAQGEQNNPNQQQQQQQQQQQVRQQPVFAQPYTLPSQNPQQVAAQYANQQAALARQEEERQRKEQEAAEKRESDKLKNQFQSAIAFALGGGMNTGSGGSAAPSEGEAVAAGSAQKAAVVNTSTNSFAPVSGTYTALGPRTLVAGTVIPVMLLTGINTDSPGQVMCQVQADVYDYNGTNLLIPCGSRLLGSYESQNVNNSRVALTFSSLQTTDGGSWSIGNSLVAMDGAGYSGISGKLHRHTAAKVSGGLMGSAIAALGSLAAGNTSSVNTYSAGQIAAQGALANLIQTTSSMFNDAAKIKNTVTVEPGYMFNVYVTNNISF